MSTAPVVQPAVLVNIPVTVDTTGPSPVITVPPQIPIPFAGNVTWTCNTPGDLCMFFSNSAYPFALTQASGNGGNATLGPFAVSGNLNQAYSYRLGWRQDDTQSWTFTDPIVIVDNPS